MTFVAAMILSLALQDQDRIQDLIKKLGSDDFTTREQASEDLKKAGKSAREALKKAAEESDDPEVRQRARRSSRIWPRRRSPRSPPHRPGQGGLQGFSGVSVRTVNGDSTYTITPGDGSPALTFHKAQAGQVKLDYMEGGEAKSASSVNLDAFLKDHKELAQKYGISEEGIDYGGSRVSFKGQMFPKFNVPLFPLPSAEPRPAPPLRSTTRRRARPVAGALLAPVEDSLRAQLDLPEGQGAVVLEVTPGSLAAALGLKKSDVLLEIDGKKITSPESAKGSDRRTAARSCSARARRKRSARRRTTSRLLLLEHLGRDGLKVLADLLERRGFPGFAIPHRHRAAVDLTVDIRLDEENRTSFVRDPILTAGLHVKRS
jgi:hypothetical protein